MKNDYRDELKAAILSCDAKKIKKLKSRGPVLISQYNGKIFKLVTPQTGFGMEDIEISIDEYEKLKEESDVIELTQADGVMTGRIYTSEQELIEDMEREEREKMKNENE
jgi:hypothetical protein